MTAKVLLLAICGMALHMIGVFNGSYASVPQGQFVLFVAVALLSAVLLFLPTKPAKAGVEEATAAVSMDSAKSEVDKVAQLLMHQMLITGGGHIRILRVPDGWLYSIRFSDWVFVPDVRSTHSFVLRNVVQTTPFIPAEPGVQ